MAGITLLLRVFMLLLIGGTVLLSGTPAQRIRVRRQNMKVRINATGDTIVMKFVRPSQDVKLEGYILGYGRSVFSKQFIQLPENGQMYETELDAEPKYLVAVQPIPVKDGKKHCTGKVNLEKPLHLVIGSISPTAVLLSWGNHLKTPYEKNIMNECLEDGFYTIRYRERNRKWIYQTCPTSDTVIDHLKPDTQYEFGVRSNKDDRSGLWSKPVIHNTNMGNKKIQKPYKPRKTVANSKFHSAFPPPPALQNRTRTRVQPGYSKQVNPGAARTSSEKGNSLRINRTRPADRLTPALPKLLPSTTPRTNITASPVTNLPSNGDSLHGQTTKAPSRAPEKHPNTAAAVRAQDGSSLLRSALATERVRPSTWGESSRNVSPSLPVKTSSPAASPVSMRNPLFPFSNSFRQLHSPSRSSSSSPTSGILGVNGQPRRGISSPKLTIWPRARLVNNSVTENRKPGIPSVFGRSRASMEEQHHGSSVRTALNSRPNDVRKPGETDKVNRPEKSGNPETLKVKVQAGTTKPTKQERRQTISTAAPTAVTRQESWEDSDLFKSQPTSDVDALGKKRYVAPHVVYKTGKKPDEPCSITSSLNYFPEDEPGEVNVTSPPRNPPSNLTVVTVEGCPSFIILDWEKPDNHTTEYEVISTAKGPDGERVSILTTNQTHTAVENLNPESSYEFKVKPKNELGEGPLSEPVSFNTESADPRVSENVSGKDAIWTQFPFKTDSYSDCHGKQYVKRTWYRKFVGVQLCNSLRYKIYLGETLNGEFHNIGDQSGFGEDHCQFVDSFLDGRTGRQLRADQLPSRNGFFRALRQEPVNFGLIGGHSHINYVSWYECGTPIPGKW
ncbi:PREDICTED: target of Nesh-SH3-like isoform X2 [Cyprinodon variegatus]|uniref:ABI family, member 3 (NESH) binding protein b n=1 Tax=Cyprinodon variegatus TaxID=28743 RepID=A0A3Q2C6X9_CYPVA|nr:PREDICTED: target of Nesh-SH3-like isoform X2 [Cyprinodon variegatus]